MYCPNCKQEFDGKFCPECGTKTVEVVEKMVKMCPNCKVETESKFCPECGAKIEEMAARVTSSGDIVSLDKSEDDDFIFRDE